MNKIRSFFKGADEHCLRGLLFLLPFGLATVQHYASILFLLMSAIVVSAIFFKELRIKYIVYKYRYVFGAVLLFYFASLFSFINASDLTGAVKKLGKISYLLMSVPFIVYFFEHNQSRFFKLGIYFSAPLNFLIAVFSVYYQGSDRAHGYYHAIIYGDIMILFGSVLLLDFMNMKKFNRYYFFEIVFILLYFTSGFLSGSRGAIFSLPVIVFAILMMSGFSAKVKFFSISILCSIVIFTLVSISYVPAGKYRFVDRINITGTNIAKYIQGENKNSSLGQRLMMWEISADIFKEHPFIGTGLGDFQGEVKARMERKETELSHAWPHAHNIYFNFLATTGLFGLLTLLLVFGSPLTLLSKWSKDCSFVDLKFLAVSILTFMMFGLTEDWFSRSVLVIAFVVSFVVFASASRQPD